MTSICLIAEADPFIASLLQRFAEESGLHSVRARTGEEILSLVQQAQPTVLIVEPELPGEMRGWEAVRAMQARTTKGRVAVISCSWLNKTDACRLLGDVAGHLQKPDLHYADFVKTLTAAGTTIEDQVDAAHYRP